MLLTLDAGLVKEASNIEYFTGVYKVTNTHRGRRANK